MIENAAQLNATLHQLASFVDSLDALQLDCAGKDDFRLFPDLSDGYLSRIRELNAEIRDYLKTQPELLTADR